MKPRACAHCQSQFQPLRMGQRACSPTCAMRLVRAEKAQGKRELRARKEKAKPLSYWKAQAQAAVNWFVLHIRDAGKPCISCGSSNASAYQAGHFRSRGAAPHLALDTRNINRQCLRCNLHLAGNLIGYRAGLVERFGLAYVESIEADNEPRHYSADDFKAIRDEFRNLRKLEKV